MYHAASKTFRTFSLSTWFWLPEQGMKHFELLSRASVTCVEWRQKRGGCGGGGVPPPAAAPEAAAVPAFHIITSQHVTHPYAYERYYPLEAYPWLPHVREGSVRASLEVRRADGALEDSFSLSRRMFRHPSRDVSAVHIDHDELEEFGAFVARLRGDGIEFTPMALGGSAVPEGSPLSFYGHQLVSMRDEATGDDDSLLLPTVVRGALLGRTDLQTFARTESTLEWGMCGGPVVAGGADGRECVGIVEGIVPELTGSEAAAAGEARAAISGCAAYVESAEVASFLRGVEDALAAGDGR